MAMLIMDARNLRIVRTCGRWMRGLPSAWACGKYARVLWASYVCPQITQITFCPLSNLAANARKSAQPATSSGNREVAKVEEVCLSFLHSFFSFFDFFDFAVNLLIRRLR
jgi:hypothetical protein